MSKISKIKLIIITTFILTSATAFCQTIQEELAGTPIVPWPEASCVKVVVQGTFYFAPVDKEFLKNYKPEFDKQMAEFEKMNLTREQIEENKRGLIQNLEMATKGSETSISGTLVTATNGFVWHVKRGDDPDSDFFTWRTPDWEDTGIRTTTVPAGIFRTNAQGGNLWDEVPAVLKLTAVAKYFRSHNVVSQNDGSVLITLSDPTQSDVESFPHASTMKYLYQPQKSKSFPVKIESVASKSEVQLVQYTFDFHPGGSDKFPASMELTLSTSKNKFNLITKSAQDILPVSAGTLSPWLPGRELVQDKRFDPNTTYNYLYNPSDSPSAIATKARTYFNNLAVDRGALHPEEAQPSGMTLSSVVTRLSNVPKTIQFTIAIVLVGLGMFLFFRKRT